MKVKDLIELKLQLDEITERYNTAKEKFLEENKDFQSGEALGYSLTKSIRKTNKLKEGIKEEDLYIYDEIFDKKLNMKKAINHPQINEFIVQEESIVLTMKQLKIDF